MSPETASAPRRLFYGWYVVFAVGLVLMTTAGLAFYNLAVLLDAFVAERGFPVVLTSGATAAFFLATGVSGVMAGQLMERFDPRIVIIASATLAGLALAFVGQIETTWQLYLFYIVFGLCHGSCGLVPGTTLVARWFETRRPLALSIASTGLSLGGIFITPVSALLIKNLGLSGAGPWLGLLFFIGIVPATTLLVRARPQDMGLQPDGATAHSVASRAAASRGVPLGEARRSRFFIGVTAAYVFALGSQVAAIAHLFRLASTRESAEVATAVVAILAMASVVGRLTGGALLLRVPSRAFTLAIVATQSLALALLAVASSTAGLIAGTALFGVMVGNILMMQPLLLAEAFGTRDYGRIYSVSQFVSVIGVAGGPFVLGLIYEASGGYVLPYLVMAVSSLLGLVILALAGPTRQPSAAPHR